MKRISVILLSIVGISFLMLNSCQNEDLLFLDDFQKGAFLKFVDAPNPVLGVNTIDELVFNGEIEDPTGNVVKYDLKLVATLSGVEQDTVIIGTYTSFPLTLNLTVDDFSSLLEVTISDITFGDNFQFIGSVTHKNGTVYYDESPDVEVIGEDEDGLDIVKFIPGGLTHPTLSDPTLGYKSALGFEFTIGCPPNTYDPATIAGTYNAFSASWAVDGPVTITVDGDDPYTLYVDGVIEAEGIPGNGEPMVWHVDPETNEVTCDPEIIASDYYGYADMYYEGSGTLFPCAGNTFNMALSPQILNVGGWGPQGFTFTKQ